MLLLLAEALEPQIRAFNVFSYITLRAVLATMTALVISFLIGPRMIGWLSRMKIGQSVRHDGPQTHLIKAGTPTMGGALILVSIVVTTLLWGNLGNRFVWVVLLVTLGFGAVGWVDDWRKVVYRNPKGLSARSKFLWQSLIGLVRRRVPRLFHLRARQHAVPPLALRVGAKRLQRGPVAQGGPDRAVLQDRLLSARRLGLHRAHVLRDRRHQQRREPHRRARRPRDHAHGDGGQRRSASSRTWWATRSSRAISSSRTFPARASSRSSAARSPARVSASSGSTRIRRTSSWATSARWRWAAALGTIAIIVRQEIVLFIMGGVFVVETLSVMIQVISFKTRGKRVFRMAPIHHHFELKGWKENQVVVRFWIITMLLGAPRPVHAEAALGNAIREPQCRGAGARDDRAVDGALPRTRRGTRARGRYPRRASARGGTRDAAAGGAARHRAVRRRDLQRCRPHRDQSRCPEGSAGDRGGHGARGGTGRRHRTLRPSAPAGAEGARDHGIERQERP